MEGAGGRLARSEARTLAIFDQARHGGHVVGENGMEINTLPIGFQKGQREMLRRVSH